MSSDLYSQAMAEADQGRWQQALPLFEAAFQADPSQPKAAEGWGVALCNLGQFEQAISVFEKALELQPDLISTLSNLGAALQCLGRWDQAIHVLTDAVKSHSDHAQAHYNLAHAQQHQGLFEQAAASYRQALVLNPVYRQALTNLSVVLRELGQVEDAIPVLEQAIALEPDNATSHFNLAFMELQTGQMQRGWAEHEWRFQAGITIMRNDPQKLWQGQDIAGQTLLVWCEQGFGDTLQFVRFLPLLAKRGIRVILEVQPQLHRLLQGIDGADQVFAMGQILPDFDHHIPLMSLPYLLGIGLENVAQHSPYLRVDRGATEVKDKPRIGLVWSGSSTHKNDRNRSMALQDILPLLDLHQVQFVSLQIDADTLPIGLQPPPIPIADFKDTAQVVAGLDLVITVDTSVAHLAGALAVPVWTMLPFAPDWRWLMGRDDTPWYPSMRLFRQSKPGDWGSVVERVRQALRFGKR